MCCLVFNVVLNLSQKGAMVAMRYLTQLSALNLGEWQAVRADIAASLTYVASSCKRSFQAERFIQNSKSGLCQSSLIETFYHTSSIIIHFPSSFRCCAAYWTLCNVNSFDMLNIQGNRQCSSSLLYVNSLLDNVFQHDDQDNVALSPGYRTVFRRKQLC